MENVTSSSTGSNTTTTDLYVSSESCRHLDSIAFTIAMAWLPVNLVFVSALWKSGLGRFCYLSIGVTVILVINKFYMTFMVGMMRTLRTGTATDTLIIALPVISGIGLGIFALVRKLANAIAPFVLVMFLFMEFNVTFVSIPAGIIALITFWILWSSTWEMLVRTLLISVINTVTFVALFVYYVFKRGQETLPCGETRNLFIICNENCQLVTDDQPFTDIGMERYMVPLLLAIMASFAGIVVRKCGQKFYDWICCNKKQEGGEGEDDEEDYISGRAITTKKKPSTKKKKKKMTYVRI